MLSINLSIKINALRNCEMILYLQLVLEVNDYGAAEMQSCSAVAGLDCEKLWTRY